MSAQEVEMNSIKRIKSVLKIKVVQGCFFFALLQLYTQCSEKNRECSWKKRRRQERIIKHSEKHYRRLNSKSTELALSLFPSR